MGLELIEKQLMPHREVLPSIVFENILELKKSCETAVDILNDLLTYEKLESGLLILEKIQVNPLEFIESTIRPFRLQAANAGLDLKWDIPLTVHNALRDYDIDVDVSKMSQVIRNIVSNAIKFSHPGGEVMISLSIPEPSIHARRKSSHFFATANNIGKILHRKTSMIVPYQDEQIVVQKMLRVEVKDSGYGLSPENMKKLFHEVIQFEAKAQQGGGGSGLGLWISKKIVDMHEGNIGAHSEGLGHGCTFHVEIPLVPAEAPVLEKQQVMVGDEEIQLNGHHGDASMQSRSGTGGMKALSAPLVVQSSHSRHFVVTREEPTSIPKKTYKFLAVDDSTPTRKMMTMLLTSSGHTCVQAEDGAIAVQRYLENESRGEAPFDVILMDNVMPNMNGPDACKRIRELGYTGIVLGVTGNALAVDIEEFIASGANQVLIKPISIGLLHRTIDAHSDFLIPDI